MSRAASLRSIICADTPSAWQKAGFSLGGPGLGQNEVQLGPLRITLSSAVEPTSAGKKGVSGFTGWTWSNLPSDCALPLAGIPTASVDDQQVRTPVEHRHPNGIIGVDHIVLKTNNIEHTKASFLAAGVSLRKERSDIYPGITQCFFRPNGETIIEVVGPSTQQEDGKSDISFFGDLQEKPSLWGVTFVSGDMERTKEVLGDCMGKIRKAKQNGRMIATLRSELLNISVAMAVMTPHNPSSSRL